MLNLLQKILKESVMDKFAKNISNIFLWVMNLGLLIIGILLSFGLLIEAKEIFEISSIGWKLSKLY